MDSKGSSASPPPPPLPPTRLEPKPSSIETKVRAAPPGWAFVGRVVEPIVDPFLTPPAGTYFLYGTLRDSTLLAEILDLDSPPVLRPAYVIGYNTKLWGGYPALVDKEGEIVEGSAFEVTDLAAAAKLAYYETSTYRPTPCNIRFKDSTDIVPGFTFMYCGKEIDLDDGKFDLDVWLRRMGRKPADLPADLSED